MNNPRKVGKVPKASKCPNCGALVMNPARYPHLLCKGKTIPLGQRHTLLPEPTERDKQLIHEAHTRIMSAKKLIGVVPGALITQQAEGLHLKLDLKPESSAPLPSPEDIQESLRRVGWEMVDPSVSPDCISGYLRETAPTTTQQQVSK